MRLTLLVAAIAVGLITTFGWWRSYAKIDAAFYASLNPTQDRMVSYWLISDHGALSFLRLVTRSTDDGQALYPPKLGWRLVTNADRKQWAPPVVEGSGVAGIHIETRSYDSSVWTSSGKMDLVHSAHNEECVLVVAHWHFILLSLIPVSVGIARISKSS